MTHSNVSQVLGLGTVLGEGKLAISHARLSLVPCIGLQAHCSHMKWGYFVPTMRPCLAVVGTSPREPSVPLGIPDKLHKTSVGPLLKRILSTQVPYIPKHLRLGGQQLWLVISLRILGSSLSFSLCKTDSVSTLLQSCSHSARQ